MKDKPGDIILASESPRRQELLKRIVPEFRIIPSGVNEDDYRESDPVIFALRAAEAKAREVGEKCPSSLVIAADTLVCLGDEVFGKPKDRGDAEGMLQKLSGHKHRVITAVALWRKSENHLLTAYEVSYVTFKKLSKEQIDAYLDRGEHEDKAGSYAIQEIGDAFVEKLEGDYDNVVGLPVRRLKRLLDEFLSPEHMVSIHDLAFPNSWGVGTAGKAVVFVPGTVPGDKVRLQVIKKKRRYLIGRVISLEEPSPSRIEPECPHFGECGGCAFQNLAYAKQLELKESYLLKTLQKIGGIGPETYERKPIAPSPALFFYRNKMEYAFGGKGRDIFLGLRARALPLEKYGKTTTPLQKCLIFSRAVETIFPVFSEYAEKTGLAAFNPMTRQGYFRNLVLREGKNSGEIMAVLVTKSSPTLGLSGLAEKLREKVPQVKSFWRVGNDRVSDVVDFAGKEHIFGKESIDDSLAGLRFKIYPESFFQPNPAAAEILYDRITAEAGQAGSRRALGLYCGPGSIEMFLSRAAAEVVGIDSEPMNIVAAEENCRANGITHCRFIQGWVEDVLKERDFKDFDLLVLDPPRAGISHGGMKQITALGIPAIFYVSCNPAALARDVSLMAEKGYRLLKLFCYDFFPHTPHLESLGILVK